MSTEQMEEAMKHFLTKEEFHKEMHSLTWKIITIMFAVQIPTWIGIIQVCLLLAKGK
jgi:hypothetical protein